MDTPKVLPNSFLRHLSGCIEYLWIGLGEPNIIAQSYEIDIVVPTRQFLLIVRGFSTSP